MTDLRRLTAQDLPRLRRFWREHWSGEEIIVHGEVIHPEGVDGFVAGEWIGLVTFYVRDGQCEVISLDSLQQNRGLGTALLEAVIREARQRNCRRVFLTTTNDNLRALGFYQKRGFELAALRRGAVNESRRIKPGISMIGGNGIPLRDEIELEMSLLPSPQTPLPARAGQK